MVFKKLQQTHTYTHFNTVVQFQGAVLVLIYPVIGCRFLQSFCTCCMYVYNSVQNFEFTDNSYVVF